MGVTIEPIIIDDDTSVYFEMDQESAQAYSLVSRGAEETKEEFKKALSRVQPAANELLETLKGIADKPDEVGIEFGIKVSGSLGAIIAKSSAEANFKVTLKWKS